MTTDSDQLIALVQGANRGIGLAFVQRLLEDDRIGRLYASCRTPATATELQALGPVLRRFYDTGVAQNPCDGPCDENDLF